MTLSLILILHFSLLKQQTILGKHRVVFRILTNRAEETLPALFTVAVKRLIASSPLTSWHGVTVRTVVSLESKATPEEEKKACECWR